MKRIHLWLVAATIAIVCGLYLRVVMPYENVFTVDGVNFQETDAWYHARVVEAFLHGIPAPTQLDPYGSFPDPQRVDVGPVLDSLVTIPVLLFGFDPHTAAAWCPVILWLVLIAAVGLLARQLFGDEHACVAIILAATLPGNYLRVTSLGFHDHHVLEALLFITVLYLLSRQLMIAAGISLALYLLTFLGGAILVVFIALWRILSPAAPTLWRTFALAILILLPFRQTLWMDYSLASLTAALTLELLFLWIPKPLYRWGVVTLGAIAALWAADHYGVLSLARHFTTSKGASTVGEMKWLNPTLAWQNFGPVAAFALAGAWQLAHTRQHFQRLLVITALSFGLLGLFQVRLGYYVAVAIALLASSALTDFFNSLSGLRQRSFGPPALMLLLVVPNLWSGYKTQSPIYGSRPEWREAMQWMRWNTPEPLSSPQDFNHLLPFGPAFTYPPQAYGVFAWWDYGYEITTIGHRIPFTNPTQKNADRAARMLLASSESEFLTGLRTNRLRYAVIGADLAMMPFQNSAVGKFPSLAKWAGADQSRFFETFTRTNADGKRSAVAFYHPAYFRTPAVRLALYGTEEYIPASDICVATVEGKNAKQVECFNSEAEARPALIAPNTILVSLNPLRSCVRLEAWNGLETVYKSRDNVTRIQDRWMPALRIYRLRDN